MVVAETAGNRCASGEVLVHERPNNVTLKAIFLIHHVIGNSQIFRHAARVIHVVNRAASSLYLLRHTFATSKTALVPQLHSQPDHLMAFARSMAATVDESTPPDMATAMVCSGIKGKAAAALTLSNRYIDYKRLQAATRAQRSAKKMLKQQARPSAFSSSALSISSWIVRARRVPRPRYRRCFPGPHGP